MSIRWWRGFAGLVAVLAAGCASSSSTTTDEPGVSAAGTGSASCEDADGDGYCSYASDSRQKDCDDTDAERHPGAVEVCNLKDDNCDGTIDEDAPAACQLTCNEPAGGCETLTAIVAGYRHVCALSSAGGVYCWGSNSYGGLGSPQLSNSTLPVAVPGVANATALIGSAYTTCALTKTVATCWGAGSAMPFQILLSETTKQVAVGDKIIYALLDSGEVFYRNLLPTTTQAYAFQELNPGTPKVEITASGELFCTLDADGTLFCPEGANRDEIQVTGAEKPHATLDWSVCYTKAGELHCIESDGLDRTPAGNGSAVGVGKSDNYACAYAASGKTACWSDAGPKTITDAQQLAVGATFGCVLRTNGKVSCWGSGDSGTLGDGRVGNVSAAEPVDIKPGPELKLEGKALLGTPKLGACDTLTDLAYITHAYGTGALHSSFSGCSAQCQNTLDSSACYASCTKNPGLSDGCFACFGDLAACTGADCYATFNACAGFPVDFLATIGNEPRFECKGADCMVGEQLGHDCKAGKDCMSGACGMLPQFHDHNVCVSSDGGTCYGTGSCDCSRGYCGGCYANGRIASANGTCYRDCTHGESCEFGQQCRFFSDFEQKYCE